MSSVTILRTSQARRKLMKLSSAAIAEHRAQKPAPLQMVPEHLPSNLEILPGIRSTLDGRSYRYGRYPSGKTVAIPYREVDAPPARMIPEPEERKPVRKRKEILTRDSQGREVTVAFKPKRLAVVEWRTAVNARMPDDARLHKHTSPFVVNTQEFVDLLLRPLMRSPDRGRTWVAVEAPPVDWMVQYHTDEEPK